LNKLVLARPKGYWLAVPAGNSAFARELDRPCRIEWTARALSVLGPFVAASGGWALSSSVLQFDQGFIVFFAGGMVSMGALAMMLFMRSRRLAARRVLTGTALIARWRCDPSAFARPRRAPVCMQLTFAGLVAAVFTALWFGVGPWLGAAITAVLALSTLGMVAGIRSQRLEGLAHEVWIARDAMVVGGELVAWTGVTRLESVTLERRDGHASLLFTLSVHGRGGRQAFSIRAPVPTDAERAASKVVRALQSVRRVL
jgi:hypothetical protein